MDGSSTAATGCCNIQFRVLLMSQIVSDFALAFKAVDDSAPKGRSRTREYRAGIGPLTENEAITRALAWLKQIKPSDYSEGGPRAYPNSRQICDLVLPGQWAVECKLIRPFGDNGVEAEHWSENVLHPYSGNVSSVGDAIKLNESGFAERKGILVFGYEHLPPRINLDLAVRCFEVICSQVLRIPLSERHSAEFSSLIHPSHQHGKVFGWEVRQNT
jgi:hypothetical protein